MSEPKIEPKDLYRRFAAFLSEYDPDTDWLSIERAPWVCDVLSSITARVADEQHCREMDSIDKDVA